ncbi:FAD binding domain-containing protein [Nocardioides luteus]|uniref:FAD binding domain-containing protein n=1 Tax=Nocardioides luteus TaxID=1844 RepID=UPI0018C8FB3E|nr:FAD binding domain-containing protein [Nocardioides luteus]MBG6096836.1 carbon-monoxide dehydrogenase medium subunit [Nocardioides luteus]
MIIPPLRYLRPTSLEQATNWLTHLDGATVLAGGQTLVNALKLDLVAPDFLIDVHRLEELSGIEVATDGTVSIGAATTYAAIAADPGVQANAPAVATMAAGLVDRQVRNRGTIGGNVCLNDPTNNYPPLLLALGARFHVAGPDGIRVIEASDFFVGTLATALGTGEILVRIEVPHLPEEARVVHRHLQLAKDSWAVARCVVRLDVHDGVVAGATVALGTVLGSPVRLAAVEAALVGQPLDVRLIDLASASFDNETFEAASDVHCSADYRRRMAKVQLHRALTDLVNGDHA